MRPSVILFRIVPAVFLVLSLHSCALTQRARYFEGIFDTRVSFGDPVFEWHSARAFQGDGYSIVVHQLPHRLRERFDSPDEELLTGFPHKPRYRSRWSVEHWRQSPADERFSGLVDFALSEQGVGGLQEHYDAVRHALSTGGSFYAFFYFDTPDGYLADIDFFLVDLEGDRVYLVNFNT